MRTGTETKIINTIAYISVFVGPNFLLIDFTIITASAPKRADIKITANEGISYI